MLRAPPKDSSEERFYGLDWSDELGEDNIATSNWVSAPSGGDHITIFDKSATTKTTVVWVAAGEPGTEYRLTNTITTTGGQTRVRTLLVYCDER